MAEIDQSILDDKDRAIGEEFVEEWKNPQTGEIMFYCSLCGCQFDNKLIVLHSKGAGHKHQYLNFKEQETTEDRLVNAKHLQISLSKEEFDGVQNIVLDCEKALKTLSDEFAAKTVPAPVGPVEGEAEAETEKKDTATHYRILVGVMRSGLLSAGLLMNGETEVELILLMAEKPTAALLNSVAESLPQHLMAVSSSQYQTTADVNEACVIVTSITEPKATCKITITSPLMRTHPFRYFNEIAPPDPVDVLPREKCEEALKRMRRARWYESKIYPLPYCDLVIRIFRDLCLRVPTWNPLDLWATQVLVQKVLSSADEYTSSPGRAVRTVFECISSGILLNDSPGLYDPCEREPTDLCQLIALQERECITTSAQHALRLIAFDQMHRILGMSEAALVAAKQGGIRRKRMLSIGQDNEEGQGVKKMMLATAYDMQY
jgi:zinc finger RNA-binding protein